MSFSTPISQLSSQPVVQENPRKAPIENMSYSDILQNMNQPDPARAAPAAAMPPPALPPPPPPPRKHEPTAPPAVSPTSGGIPGGYPMPANAAAHSFASPTSHLGSGSMKPSSTSPVSQEDDSLQTDAVLIFLLVCLVHLPYSQQMLVSKIPSMFNPNTNSISIVGIVFNAVMVVALWVLLRKVAKKYIKA